MTLLKPLLSALCLALLIDGARAQDEPAPTTTSDPGISLELLQPQLDPLDKGALQVESEAWMGLVKAKATELSQAVISSREAESGSAEKDAALEVAEQRRAELKELIERFNAVLAEWEEKGGDPAEFRAYAAGASGSTLDVTDTAATANALRRWLISKDGGIKWAGKLGVFALIMLASWILARVIKRIVSAAMDRHQGSSELLDTFVKKLIGRVVVFVGLLIGLSTLGVNVSAMLALIGGASFIIAFAMQDTLSNFANGVMLLFYQPFDVGDVVEIGGVTGIVDSVSLVNTTIKTFDNKRVLVPNKSVWGQVITNITVSGTRRVDLVFGIGYGDDVEKAQAILERLVADHELVLEDPAPTIKVDELADSSVNFVVRPWVKTSDYGTVRWDLIKSVKAAFDKEGISIPFPQRDVHLFQASA